MKHFGIVLITSWKKWVYLTHLMSLTFVQKITHIEESNRLTDWKVGQFDFSMWVFSWQELDSSSESNWPSFFKISFVPTNCFATLHYFYYRKHRPVIAYIRPILLLTEYPIAAHWEITGSIWLTWRV